MAGRGVPSMAPGQRGFDLFADTVLAAMEAQAVNVTELARLSGVPRPILSFWLNGRRPLRADYLHCVLEALELGVRPKSL